MSSKSKSIMTLKEIDPLGFKLGILVDGNRSVPLLYGDANETFVLKLPSVPIILKHIKITGKSSLYQQSKKMGKSDFASLYPSIPIFYPNDDFSTGSSFEYLRQNIKRQILLIHLERQEIQRQILSLINRQPTLWKSRLSEIMQYKNNDIVKMKSQKLRETMLSPSKYPSSVKKYNKPQKHKIQRIQRMRRKPIRSRINQPRPRLWK